MGSFGRMLPKGTTFRLRYDTILLVGALCFSAATIQPALADDEAEAKARDDKNASIRTCSTSSFAHLSALFGNFNKVKSETAIAACSKVIAEPGHSKYRQAAALRYIGESHMDLGNYQQALSYFEKSSVYNSSEEDTYSDRGEVYEKLRMPKEAISSYEQAVRLAPARASLYQKLAIIYNDQGQYDFAIAYMDKAIELAPDEFKGNFYKNRGTIWSNKGDSDRARADYAKSIEFNSKR